MVPDYDFIGRWVVTMLPWWLGYIAGSMSIAEWDEKFDNLIFLLYAAVVGIITFLVMLGR